MKLKFKTQDFLTEVVTVVFACLPGEIILLRKPLRTIPHYPMRIISYVTGIMR